MKTVAENKKARFDYEILDTVEAGIELRGDEVKSIRNNTASLSDSYAIVSKGQIVLLNCYIAPYAHSYVKSIDDTTRRSRTLLLHKKEINRMIGDVSRKGLTLIPLKMYFNERGYCKVLLGLAKHKKTVDKKRELKEKDIKRETQRLIRGKF
ncbi:MAG: SsrA-binding protein [candidate division TM6 bacterium GW2011_GWF2_36_6]|nr:MAG: SsrA-binding protein [candidate division TM6 bacterium GW2011_GWF2_36_6]